MNTDRHGSHFQPRGKVRDALLIIEDTDKYRNLLTVIPLFLFLVSAGFAMLSFFWLIDFTTWLGFDRFEPEAPAMISYVLIFVVWIFAFTVFMFAVQKMNFKDVRSVGIKTLSELALNPCELDELRHVVTSRSWRHGQIWNSVLDHLMENTLTFNGGK